MGGREGGVVSYPNPAVDNITTKDGTYCCDVIGPGCETGVGFTCCSKRHDSVHCR